jgi:uncharacterized membrane protein (DUF4010 family)
VPAWRIIGRAPATLLAVPPPPMPTFDLNTGAGLAVALGLGLLIGTERERRKGRGPGRAAAGLRTFTLAALAGALAQWLGQPVLVALGAAAVGVLTASAYWHGRRTDPDPGLTTELALFVTYLLGVLAVVAPALAAGAGVVVAALLAARTPMHRFATRVLTGAELHDLLLLAALGLVLLPLLPAGPVAVLGGVSPRQLLMLFTLILLVQGLGHVALRAAGPHVGLPLAGLLSGMVSSTATVAAMGARVRADPALRRPAVAAALASGVATWAQAALMLAAASPALLRLAAPALVAGGLTAVVVAVAGWQRGAEPVPPAGGDGGARGGARGGAPQTPLRLREAAIVALLLGGASVLVAQVQAHAGATAAMAAAALAAVADAHASIAATAALHAQGRLDDASAGTAVLLALVVNTVVRTAVAALAGGPGYAVRVGGGLAAGVAVGGAVYLWTG